MFIGGTHKIAHVIVDLGKSVCKIVDRVSAFFCESLQLDISGRIDISSVIDWFCFATPGFI